MLLEATSLTRSRPFIDSCKKTAFSRLQISFDLFLNVDDPDFEWPAFVRRSGTVAATVCVDDATLSLSSFAANSKMRDSNSIREPLGEIPR